MEKSVPPTPGCCGGEDLCKLGSGDLLSQLGSVEDFDLILHSSEASAVADTNSTHNAPRTPGTPKQVQLTLGEFAFDSSDFPFTSNGNCKNDHGSGQPVALSSLTNIHQRMDQRDDDDNTQVLADFLEKSDFFTDGFLDVNDATNSNHHQMLPSFERNVLGSMSAEICVDTLPQLEQKEAQKTETQSILDARRLLSPPKVSTQANIAYSASLPSMPKNVAAAAAAASATKRFPATESEKKQTTTSSVYSRRRGGPIALQLPAMNIIPQSPITSSEEIAQQAAKLQESGNPQSLTVEQGTSSHSNAVQTTPVLDGNAVLQEEPPSNESLEGKEEATPTKQNSENPRSCDLERPVQNVEQTTNSDLANTKPPAIINEAREGEIHIAGRQTNYEAPKSPTLTPNIKKDGKEFDQSTTQTSHCEKVMDVKKKSPVPDLPQLAMEKNEVKSKSATKPNLCKIKPKVSLATAASSVPEIMPVTTITPDEFKLSPTKVPVVAIAVEDGCSQIVLKTKLLNGPPESTSISKVPDDVYVFENSTTSSHSNLEKESPVAHHCDISYINNDPVVVAVSHLHIDNGGGIVQSDATGITPMDSVTQRRLPPVNFSGLVPSGVGGTLPRVNFSGSAPFGVDGNDDNDNGDDSDNDDEVNFVDTTSIHSFRKKEATRIVTVTVTAADDDNDTQTVTSTEGSLKTSPLRSPNGAITPKYSNNDHSKQSATAEMHDGVKSDSRGEQSGKEASAEIYAPKDATNCHVVNLETGRQTLSQSPVADARTSVLVKEFDNSGDETDSSCESLDSDGDELFGTTYNIEARREHNIQRNRQRMKDLGFLKSPSKVEEKGETTGMKSLENVEHVPKQYGMLFPTPYNNIPSNVVPDDRDICNDTTDRLDEVYSRYPHRENQIKMLASILGSSIRQAVNSTKIILDGDNVSAYAPAPLFVSGPSGVGKTSVVRDVVNAVKHIHSTANALDRPPPLIRRAYVNCATLDPSSIDALVQSAYSQLVEDVKDGTQCHPKRRKRKRKNRLTQNYEQHMREYESPSKRALVAVADQLMSPMEEEKRFAIDVEEMEINEDMEDKITHRLETARKKCRKSSKRNSMSENAQRKKMRSWKENVNEGTDQASSGEQEKQLNKTSHQVEEKTAAHGACVAFGRAILPIFGRNVAKNGCANREQGCAFLILDHAERLLTLSAKKRATPERNNFLAQLLLLPKVMGLNLTVICISSSNLLDCSRVNNVAATQKALGTIQNAVTPLRIHFPAYKGKNVFKSIFNQSKMKQLIMGRSSPSLKAVDITGVGSAEDFKQRVYDSFLDILIQALSGSTRNVREMVRLGCLWSNYIEPLNSCQVEVTIESIRSRLKRKYAKSNRSNTVYRVEIEDIYKEIVAMLDQRILPQIRIQLEKGFMLSSDFPPPKADSNATLIEKKQISKSASLDLPFLSKCLIIAAFICQYNKAEKDKQLFTIQKSGRRSNKKNSGINNMNSEGLAHGSTTWEQQQLKMLRPRSFPLERMLSVFVNITGLIQDGASLLFPVGEKDVKTLLRSVGSSAFFESLAQLRDIGLLREVRGGYIGTNQNASLDQINMSSMKYWCEVTRDDAEEVAKSVDFPLSQFLM